MTARRWLVLGVLLLSGAQTVYWLGGGFLAYMFRNFFLEPGSPAIDERTRNAYLVLAWFVVNAMVLALYAERRSGLATWVMAGLQVGNLAYGLWLGIRNTSSYCFTDQSVGLLVQPLGAASALVLLYMIWRRFEGGATSTLPMLSMLVRWPIRSLPLAAVLMVVGLGLVMYGWTLGAQDIHVHSGAVVAVENGAYGRTLTVDSISKPMFFDYSYFIGLPPVRQGQRVMLLTADSPTCGYGAPVAIEISGITYIDSSGDVGGYTPDTWQVHEAIRVGALVAGFILAALGLVSLLRWIDGGVAKGGDAER